MPVNLIHFFYFHRRFSGGVLYVFILFLVLPVSGHSGTWALASSIERMHATEKRDYSETSVVINEIQASNATTIADEDGNYHDWIELYNPTGQPVRLFGYGLSDDNDDPYQWVFPDTTIAPGTFMLVWASGEAQRVPGRPLHAGFRINQRGEEILLTDLNGNRLDAYKARPVPTDLSYGRYPDGGDDKYYFSNPTPGASNHKMGFEKIIAPPIFLKAPGFYENEITLEITSGDSTGFILYTLDGSEPNIRDIADPPVTYPVEIYHPGISDSSMLVSRANRTHVYTGPIRLAGRSSMPNRASNIITTYYQPVDGVYTWQKPKDNLFKGHIIRAARYKDGRLSETKTATYLITGNGNNSPRFDLPVVSITGDLRDLMGWDKGIYVPGRTYKESGGRYDHFVTTANYTQRGDVWERPVHFELFEPHGGLLFSQNLGMRIHGGSSRKNPNKSFRLYARGQYDLENRMNYSFFPDAVKPSGGGPVDTYNRLLLRADGNLREYLNDIVACRVLEATSVGVQRSRPVVHFINGEYWGLIYLRDRLDAWHIAYNYDIDADNVIMIDSPYGERDPDFVEAGTPEDFKYYLDMYHYAIENDLADTLHYNQIKKMLDIPSYIDHKIAFIFWSNVDWYGMEHFRIWRTRTTSDAPFQDGKWRYIVWDFDEAGRARHMDYDLLYNAMSPTGGGQPPYHFGNRPFRTALFRNMLENETFRNAFINRFADHLNSTFTTGRILDILDEEYQRVAPTFGMHWERWGRVPFSDTRKAEFEVFAEKRPAIQREHILSNFDLEDTIQVALNLELSNRDTLQTPDSVSWPAPESISTPSDPQSHIRINTLDITPSTPGIPDKPYPWKGIYFSNIPLTLEAVPGENEIFLHWAGVPDSLKHERFLTLKSTQSLQITAVFESTEQPFYPGPHPLAKEPYLAGAWGPDKPAGTYPSSMAFVYMEEEHPGLDSPVAGFTTAGYGLHSGTRINGLDDGGITLINAGKSGTEEEPGYPANRLGGVLLALNTLEKESVSIKWSAGTSERNTKRYGIRLQYRLGEEGPFKEITPPGAGPIEYTGDHRSEQQHFDNIKLPAEALQQPVVQLFWRYYFTGEQLYGAAIKADRLWINDIGIKGTSENLLKRKPVEAEAILELSQNYPNPFNPVTVIRYRLPEDLEVTLQVFDMLGRRVATLVNEKIPAGSHKASFDAGKLASGIYIYRLEAGEQTLIRRMTLVR